MNENGNTEVILQEVSIPKLEETREESKPKSEEGVAHIKEEYIVQVEKNKPQTDEAVAKDETPNENNSFPNKKKKTGRNHNRPKFVKEPPHKKLCRYYWSLLPGETPGPDKCPMERCVFSHDVKTFLENKPQDLGGKCHNFSTYGFCNYGLVCRFGGCHIEAGGSRVDEELQKAYQKNPPVRNTLRKEVQIGLRKHSYDFSKAKEALREVNIIHQKNLEAEKKTATNGEPISKSQEDEEKLENKISEKDNSAEVTSDKDTKRLGPANEDDLVPLRPCEKKKVDWKDKLYLAPLTTLGNLPYRRVCRRLGADITCSEMAVATSLLQGSNSEWALVKRHSSEECFGVQLCGHNTEAMTRCALLLEKEVEMDFVDINMGCPIDLIYRQGSGSALLRRPNVVGLMVQAMSRVLSCPVTLKMRTAIYRDTQVAHTIIPKAKLWDVDMVTVHGRSKEQRYVKLADWDYIEMCARVADPVPLYGNGDILTYHDYARHKESTKVAGVMLARGALMKPWLFTEIKERRQWDISSSERLDILREFTNNGLEHWGSDAEGIEKTRRFLLEWLSFLYRYIPIGILERPQQMNQRPPVYVGRDDLETLMASSQAKDWVKISEMLLGPVPENFVFLPKHKANSWG